MQKLLSLLEIKVRGLLQERILLLQERDALAQKILDLQDQVNDLTAKCESLQKEEINDQDALFTSLVVEDLIQIIEEAEEKKTIISSNNEDI